MDATDWDHRYSTSYDPRGSAPSTVIQSRLAAAKPGQAVDIACGDGRHAHWLARCGWHVTGVDFSHVALSHARHLDTHQRIDWVHADVTTWTPNNPVDLVLITYLHLPVDDLVKLIHRAASWLNPRGHLLYLGNAYDNHTRGVGGPRDPGVLPDITNLAHAATGTFVHELRHELRPTNQGDAIDILLDLTPWAAPTGFRVRLGR